MNRDDIIDWVTQVDMAFLKRIEPWNMFDKYEAFAALVASAERKRLAKWVGLTDEEVNQLYTQIQEQVDKHWTDGGTSMMFPTTLYKAFEAKLRSKNT